MDVAKFVSKWSGSRLTERSGAHEPFIDLCRPFGHDTPAEAGRTVAEFTFEKVPAKANGRRGWADIWRKGDFAREYKGPHESLDAAHDPPLPAACDMARLVLRTNFARGPTAEKVVPLEGLAEPARRRVVEGLFHDPDRLDPGQTVEAVPRKGAGRVAG